MTLLQYAEAHPWWTLIYLSIIAMTISRFIRPVFRSACKGACCKRD